MGLTAKDSGGDFEIIEPGMYPARCIGVIDLGVHETQFLDDDGIQKNNQPVRIVFEVLGDKSRDDGKPFIVSRDFTNSLHEKSKLRPFLEAWRGKQFAPEELQGFELKDLASVYANIQIMHKLSKKGRTFPEISNALPLTQKPAPKGVNEVLVLNLDEFDQDVFDKLPKFTQEKIKDSLSWAQMNAKSNVIRPGDIDLNKVSNADLESLAESGEQEPIKLSDIPF